MLDNPEEYHKMKLAEGQLWWYKILHGHVLSVVASFFSSKDIRILDAGCGTGGLIKFMINNGYTNIKGFDLSAEAINECNKSFDQSTISQLDIREVALHYPLNHFDVIVCNDVMCYLSNSEFSDVLKALVGLLQKNGILLINLPAHDLFKGMHDRSVGIKHRWTFKRFKLICNSLFPHSLGVRHFYWPFFLSPMILFVRLIQRLKMFVYPSCRIRSDVSLPPPAFNRFFYWLTNLESRLTIKKTVGSSLFIIINRY